MSRSREGEQGEQDHGTGNQAGDGLNANLGA